MAQHPAAALEAIAFSDIPGWAEDDHAAALAAFRRSCGEIVAEGRAFSRPVMYGGTREPWLAVCEAAKQVTTPRQFFETNFTALEVSANTRRDGLFTGYYEPIVDGDLLPSARFPVPVYRRPPELAAFDEGQAAATGLKYGRVVHGKAAPFHTRQDIEQGALDGRGLEIVWLKSWADAYFVHIQGSGRVRLPDGRALRLTYAMKSGLPYTSIGGLLIGRGVFTRDEMSMQAIRSWLDSNPAAGRRLMWENRSFVFFDLAAVQAPELGPPGAQRVSLTPGRSLAVDRDFWMYGTPIWVNTETPDAARPGNFRRLMIAQDTGSAIKGPVRGDIFFGVGEDAGAIAGRMNSMGTMAVLLPNAIARNVLDRQ